MVVYVLHVWLCMGLSVCLSLFVYVLYMCVGCGCVCGMYGVECVVVYVLHVIVYVVECVVVVG